VQGKGEGVGANQTLHYCHGLTAKSGSRLAPLPDFTAIPHWA